MAALEVEDWPIDECMHFLARFFSNIGELNVCYGANISSATVADH